MIVSTPQQQFAFDLGIVHNSEAQLLDFRRSVIGLVACEVTRGVVNTQVNRAQQQLERLKSIFSLVCAGGETNASFSEAAAGFIKDAIRCIERSDSGPLRDSNILQILIKTAQFEIANYRSLIACAQVIELDAIVPLLRHNMEQKVEAAQKNMALAASHLRFLRQKEGTQAVLEMYDSISIAVAGYSSSSQPQRMA